MKILKSAIFCSMTSLILMTACTTTEPRRSEVRSVSTQSNFEGRMGNVTNIETFARSSRTSGGGAILGAIVGGALGNQVGKGDGRKAATVAGAVGGAFAGNAIEKRNRRDDEFFRVSIRFDNGSSSLYDYEDVNDLRVGDRVKVVNGQITRM